MDPKVKQLYDSIVGILPYDVKEEPIITKRGFLDTMEEHYIWINIELRYKYDLPSKISVSLKYDYDSNDSEKFTTTRDTAIVYYYKTEHVLGRKDETKPVLIHYDLNTMKILLEEFI